MKVLVFTTLYPNSVSPNHGIFTKERIAAFTKTVSCGVKVVAPVPYFPPLRTNWRWKYAQVEHREVIEDVEVYHPRYFMTPKVGMTTYGFLMFLSVLPLVSRIRREFDFDLIESHFVYPDGFAAVMLARRFKVPVTVFAEGSDITLFSQLPLIRPLLRHALCRADRVVAVSGALKETMVGMEVPQEKISVIPNGVDPEKFFPVQRDEARRLLGLLPQRKIILSVGALRSLKGFDLLIDALNILWQEYKLEDVQLLIAGEGEQRNTLEKMIMNLNLGDRVRLLGSVPNRELNLWYNAADLFCLASSREGLPCVVLEALACGVPVVATAVGGVPEVISSDAFGFLTERNARKIADTIVVSLRRQWDSAQIVRYARTYSWHDVARRCFELFEAQVTESRARAHPVV